MTISSKHAARRRARWVSWVLGGAMLIAVVAAALRDSDQRELYRLARSARPSWMLSAGGRRGARR